MKIDKELLNEHLLAFSSVSPSNSSNSLVNCLSKISVAENYRIHIIKLNDDK